MLWLLVLVGVFAGDEDQLHANDLAGGLVRPGDAPEELGQGLPGDHGITMTVRKDRQAWYAYRTTPSGYVFGIGAVGPPPSQWYYDGPEPPKAFPSKMGGWTSFMEPDPPEWRDERPTEQGRSRSPRPYLFEIKK